MNEFDQLEKFVGFTLPASLKSLLTEAGYNSLLALKMLSDENINKLENYIRSTLQPDKFDEYMNKSEFSFLPGHRSILLSLPSKIKEMELSKYSDKVISAKIRRNQIQNVMFK